MKPYKHSNSPFLVPALSPFRKTRSGSEFSPWSVEIGTPLHAPADFDLAKRLREAEELRAAMEAATSSEANDTLPGANSASDPDEPTLLPEGTVVPDASADDVFANVNVDLDTASPPVQPPETNAQTHMRNHRKARRRAKRAKQAEQIFGDGAKPIKQASLRHLQNAVALQAEADVQSTLQQDSRGAPPADNAAPIHTDYAFGDMEAQPVTSLSFIGKLFEQSDDDKRNVPVSELRGRPDWQYVPWDGRTSRPILDRNNVEFANLVGQPAWGDLNAQLINILERAKSAYAFSKKDTENRRGEFPSVASGISFGGGQKRVGNLAHTSHNRKVWNALFKLAPMRRVVHFVDHSFRKWFPDVHGFYSTTLNSLCTKDPSLKRNFDNTAFAAMSLNLGPRAVSYPHTDHLNLAYGLCAITAVGEYDHRAGGHLVLWDLKMIIEFPAGSTIIIPSALLVHSNTALGATHERRYAIVQYSAGGLFRWVECEHQTQKDFYASGRQYMQTGKERWERGVGMFSKWEDLKKRFNIRV